MRTLHVPCSVFFLALLITIATGPPGAFAQETPDQDPAAVRDFNATAALQNSGYYERAATRWQAFLCQYPKNSRVDRVTYYLGICQLHLKQYPAAHATFAKVLSTFPKFKTLDGAQYNLAMAQYQLAVQSQKAEDYTKAAQAFADTVTRYGTSPYAAKACYFQGESQYAAGDLVAATTAYGKLLQSYGSSPLVADAYYALGTAHQQLEQHADAEQTYKRFLADAKLGTHSLADEIRLRLGMSLYDQDKYAEAEKQFQPLSQIAKFEYADFATLRYGQCRMSADDANGAITIFADLEKRFSDSPYKAAAQLAAGRGLFQLEKFAEAAAKLQSLAAGSQIESIEAAYYLGRALVNDNKAPQAVDALNKVIQSIKQGPLAKLVADPAAAHFVPYVEMARIDALYEIPEQRKPTIALYDDFFKRFPQHALAPQTLYMAALASLQEADNQGARQHADQFLANKEKSFTESDLVPAVLFIAAEGYLLDEDPSNTAGHLGKAEPLYRQLVAKYPQHARVPRANLRIGWCVYQTKKYDEAAKHLTGILGALKDPDQQAEAQLLIGHSRREMKLDKEAIAAYDAALKAAPNWDRGDEVLLAAAQSFTVLNDPTNATQRLQQLATKYAESPYRAQSLYQLGEFAQQRKDYDKAVTHYNEVLQKYASSEFAPLSQYGIGSVYFAKNDDKNALDALNKLLAGSSDGDTAKRGRYLRGLVFQRLKQFESAAADLQYYLATKPEGNTALDGHYYLALCQIGLEQFEPALQTLNALIAAKSDYQHADKVYYELGHAHLARNEGAQALDAFGRLLTARPESSLAAESCFQIGHLHEQNAENAKDETARAAEIVKATAAFRQGITRSKQGVSKQGGSKQGVSKPNALREKLTYKLGDMLFQQKQYAEASKALLQQIAEFPRGELAGPGRFLAAECLYQQDQFQQALPHFEQVASDKVAKYHDQALFRAGTCAKNLSDWARSQRHFDALIKQFPATAQIHEARFGLALALEKQNQPDAAIPLYEQVTENTEAEAAARSRFRIGGIAFGRKQYEEAVEHFLLVATGYPFEDLQVDAHYEAGQCMAAQGQNDKAIVQFEFVIKKAGDKPRGKDAQNRIASLKK